MHGPVPDRGLRPRRDALRVRPLRDETERRVKPADAPPGTAHRRRSAPGLVRHRRAALRRPIGGRQVMRAQLKHLLEAAHSPASPSKVVPFRAGATPRGRVLTIPAIRRARPPRRGLPRAPLAPCTWTTAGTWTTMEVMNRLSAEAHTPWPPPEFLKEIIRRCRQPSVTSEGSPTDPDPGDGAEPEPPTKWPWRSTPARPHIARVYDYWLGGKDNFAAGPGGRRAGDGGLPGDRLRRCPRAAAPSGPRGALPGWRWRASGSSSTSAPACPRPTTPTRSPSRWRRQSRIVYVDNDPLVLAHARALLGQRPRMGAAAYLDADLRDT